MNPDICVSVRPTPGRRFCSIARPDAPSSLLVINADGPETRVALVEDGYLGELYIERKRERGIAGNIYKGRVERVLPGMQAAFVNIGLEKSAYLHVSDVRGTPDDLKRLLSAESNRAGDDEDEDADDAARAGGGARIEDLLKEGQEIVVQVTKEPISTKGARTTRYISLPGRHLVFMPTVDHVGISRRIGSDKERRRLRDIVESMRPPGSGFIVRTVAEGVSERELKADMEFLIKLWNEVVRRAESGRCPSLIYNDLDLLLRTVRDLFTADVEKLIIDSRARVRPRQEVHRARSCRTSPGTSSCTTATTRSSTATASRSRSTARWSARSGSSRAAT